MSLPIESLIEEDDGQVVDTRETIMTIAETSLPTRFAARHIGPSPVERSPCSRRIDAASIGELLEQTLPPGIRQRDALDLGPALSEPRGIGKGCVRSARKNAAV